MAAERNNAAEARAAIVRRAEADQTVKITRKMKDEHDWFALRDALAKCVHHVSGQGVSRDVMDGIMQQLIASRIDRGKWADDLGLVWRGVADDDAPLAALWCDYVARLAMQSRWP